MTRLALASLRHRTTASLATFLTVLLGTALMGSFATLAQAATGPVSDTDRTRSSSWARSSAAGAR